METWVFNEQIKISAGFFSIFFKFFYPFLKKYKTDENKHLSSIFYSSLRNKELLNQLFINQAVNGGHNTLKFGEMNYH